MKIALKEIEKIVDEAILKKGLSCFKRGQINKFSEISKGDFKADFFGKKAYTVHLKLKYKTIVDHNCNCASAKHAICMHQVAAIYHLKQQIQSNNKPIASPPIQVKTKTIEKPKQKPKQKTIQKPAVPQLKDILDKVSHADLKEFILQHSKTDKQFEDVFLLKFANKQESQSKDFYQQAIKSILDTATDKQGLISWSKISYLEDGIVPIVEISETQLENKNYSVVVNICTALMEEMTLILQNSDDGNICLESIIEGSYLMLCDVASKNISKEVSATLFDYSISAFKNRLYKGWEWHIGMLEMAYILTDNEQDADTIIKCIDTIKEDDELERAEAFKLDIIQKYKGKVQVQKFVERHLANPSIRESEITKAIDDKNYKKAIHLAKGGIECDGEDKPELIRLWHSWLLKIAQKQKNKPKTIEYARLLLIDGLIINSDYYKILKQSIKSNKWKEFLETLIIEITSNNSENANILIRQIFINEKWWDRLFALMKEHISLEAIEDNEVYLRANYKQELIQLYSDELIAYIDVNKGRKQYQFACRYLHKIKNLDASEKADELIAFFRNKYSKRKALLDELNNL